MNALPTGTPLWFEGNGAPVGEYEDQTPVSLAQARRQGLLPSVQNILSVIARPAIDQSAAEELARTARLCADIQRGAEQVARGLDVGPEVPLRPWLGFFGDWVAERCLEFRWIGQTVIHQALGYAATPWMLIDCRGGGLTLVDLRIQGPASVTRPFTYRLWGYEMAAWQMALRAQGVTDPFRCLTLVMNAQEPHPPVEGVWSEEHLTRCKRGFLAARQLWAIENGYLPFAHNLRRAAA
jgi:hypothetical protein